MQYMWHVCEGTGPLLHLLTGLGGLLQVNALVLVQFDALVTDLWDRNRV